MSPIKFSDRFKELQALIAAGPSEESLARLAELVKEPVLYRYAFSALSDPEWIGPLATMGFFRLPPEPHRDAEQGTISYSAWPESQFLARMSANSPALVCELIVSMPATDNVIVHRDLLEAALAMAPRLAALIARRENQWLNSQSSVFLGPASMGLSRLVRHLAEGHERDIAFDLARSLFEILPDPRPEGTLRDTHALPTPRTRLEIWGYDRSLRSLVPSLVSADREKALSLVFDLLDSAIKLSVRLGDDRGTEDYSGIWCPSIESGDVGAPDLKKTLVGVVWETTSLLAKAGEPMLALLSSLEGKRWNVFRRIALLLMRKFPDGAGELIAARLTERELFDNVPLRSEYILLLKAQFGELSGEQKELILSWIDQGPNLETYRRNFEIARGIAPSVELVERFLKNWRGEHLAPLAAYLTGERKKEYGEFVAERNRLEALEFSRPEEQESLPDFDSMKVADVANYLRKWQPSRERNSRTPHGMGQLLTGSVAEDPARFADQAELFQGLDPTYVTAVLEGFDQAIRFRKELQFSWEKLLRLCRWTVGQVDLVPRQDHPLAEVYPNWSWARNTIARLLSAGFESQACELPFTLREAAWAVLSPLATDSDPRGEIDPAGRTSDPINLSINSIRGNALHAVIRYALWVGRHLNPKPNINRAALPGFSEMPEVKNVLGDHLDPVKDPARSIRSVYGQWLPWLVFLDPVWVRENIDRIFSFDEAGRILGETAWTSYIVVCQAFDDVFDILRPQYERAVLEMAPTQTERGSVPDPKVQVGNHLMVYYWRGKLPLDDELLRAFYDRAEPSVRGESLEFIGRALKGHDADNISSVVLDRLKALWAWRLETAQSAQVKKDFSRELAAFAWWFSSARFETLWSVDQQLKALQLEPHANLPHLVLERLAEIGEEAPLQSLKCLKLIVEGDSEGSVLAGWEDQCRKVLSVGVSSTVPEVRDFAEDLIQLLGASGYLSFLDLLSRSAS
jgi:hypothetical protein